jgi:hypothetical protein
MSHVVCSTPCAIKHTEQKRAKADRATLKAAKAKLKTRSQYQAEAQKTLNAWVRDVRDNGKGCISCGTRTGAMHAGHYLSRGAHADMALCPDNIYKQCARCNLYQHGNLIAYRANLVAIRSDAFVQWLEGAHPSIKITIVDLVTMRAMFVDLTKRQATAITDGDLQKFGLVGKIHQFNA